MIPVSLASATDNRTTASDLATIHRRIVSGELADLTAAVRAAPDRDARNAIKRKLPAFIPAGLFSERRRAAWSSASGLVVADFDHCDDLPRQLASLRADPSVALCFASPSGDGVKACVRVPLENPDEKQHAAAFAAVARWAREVHQAEIDRSGSDPARLCYLCHDPAALLNQAAVPLDLGRWAPAPEPVRTPPPRSERSEPGDLLRRAAAYLDRLPPSIEHQQGHSALLRAAVALVHGFDLSDADALPLLENFNARAVPPWEPRDLARKLAEARRIQHREPVGWLRDASRPEHPKRASEGQPRMQVDVDSEVSVATSEAAIAAALAESSLCARLRWRGGVDATWCEWTGRAWEPSGDKLPLALQAAVRRAVAAALDARAIDPNVARRLESAGSVRGIASMLSAWPSMRLAAECDPPGLLAMPVGVLDLDSGAMLPHDPSMPITKACPVDPEDGSIYWGMIQNHLESCLGDVYEPLHRYLGSAIIGRPADRKLAWLVGPGGDGKSSLARALRLALGSHAANVPGEALAAESRRGAHGHELASGLMFSRLAIASECPGVLNWELVKGIAGGDAIVSKRLHGRAQTCDRPPHLLLLSNEVPTVPDAAAADRVLLCRLQPVLEPCAELGQVLATPGAERDALAAAALQWLLKGAAAFIEHGIGPHPRFGGPVCPTLGDWWREVTASGVVVPGVGQTPLGELVVLAGIWCSGRGLPQPSDREVSAFLRGVLASRHTKAGNRWLVTVKAGEPSKPTPTRVREGTVSRVHQGSPTPSYTVSL